MSILNQSLKENKAVAGKVLSHTGSAFFFIVCEEIFLNEIIKERVPRPHLLSLSSVHIPARKPVKSGSAPISRRAFSMSVSLRGLYGKSVNLWWNCAQTKGISWLVRGKIYRRGEGMIHITRAGVNIGSYTGSTVSYITFYTVTSLVFQNEGDWWSIF